MDTTYSLNPRILPPAPISHNKYPYLADMAIVAVVGALIAGLLYWWSVDNSRMASTAMAPMSPGRRAQTEALVMAELKTAIPPSPQQAASGLAQLKKSNAASTADIQNALAQLKAK